MIRFRRRWALPCVLFCLLALGSLAQTAAPDLFQQATNAYSRREYGEASSLFRTLARTTPASGTFQNLGNAEWQLGRIGEAVLAWEQALWIDPYNTDAVKNLAFARLTGQLESPELAWHEVVSTWLPLNAWPWIAGCSLWLAVGLVLLPGMFGRVKAAWHQAMAAFALMIFLLSLPAQFGIASRQSLAFVLREETVLRLTPTREAQVLTRLAPGEPVRCQEKRGAYVLVRTSRFTGWVQEDEIGRVCPSPGSADASTNPAQIAASES